MKGGTFFRVAEVIVVSRSGSGNQRRQECVAFSMPIHDLSVPYEKLFTFREKPRIDCTQAKWLDHLRLAMHPVGIQPDSEDASEIPVLNEDCTLLHHVQITDKPRGNRYCCFEIQVDPIANQASMQEMLCHVEHGNSDRQSYRCSTTVASENATGRISASYSAHGTNYLPERKTGQRS